MIDRIALALVLAAAPGPLGAVKLAPDAAAADAALLRATLEAIHPGLDRYASRAELDAAFARVGALAAGGPTDLELYVEISRLLAAIRCSHTKAEPPRTHQEFRAANATHAPFRFLVDGERMFVAAGAVAAPRTEVLSIDGRSPGEIAAAILPFVPVDGFTDHVRPLRFAEDSECVGGGSAFEQFYGLLFGLGPRFRLELRSPAGAVTTVWAPPVTRDTWLALAPGGAANFRDAVSLRNVDAATSVLAVDTFVNYRKPVDPEAVYGPIFRDLKARGVRHLVIDLRRNGGGSDDAALALARFLMAEPFRMGRPARVRARSVPLALRKHLFTWDEGAFDPPESLFRELSEGGGFEFREAPPLLSPHPDRFGGRVTLLVGPDNGSGATHLVAKLADAGRVRTVGEPTGGSAEGATAGTIFFLDLPASGIRVRVPAIRSFIDVDPNRFPRGRGVDPDVLVRPSLDDLFSGRDPVIEAALRER